MAITDINTALAIRIRAAVATASHLTEDGESETSFDVRLADNTLLGVTVTDGVVTVARVMPGGHIAGQVVFTRMPGDVTIDAVVAMANALA